MEPELSEESSPYSDPETIDNPSAQHQSTAEDEEEDIDTFVLLSAEEFSSSGEENKTELVQKKLKRRQLWERIFKDSKPRDEPPHVQYDQGLAAFFACQYERAYLLFTAAARAGHADATARMGWCLYWGYGVKQAKRAAYRASQRALRLGATATAWTLLGVCSADRDAGVEQNLEEAFNYLQRAHEAGDPVATCELGTMYMYGTGVTANGERARELFAESMKSGYLFPQTCLGLGAHYGYGCKRDEDEAERWYREAAAGGERLALFSLGDLYRGRAEAEAAAFYYQAAEAGHRAAQKNVPDWQERARERELRRLMARWLLTYFGACLDCDMPILEALYVAFQANPLPTNFKPKSRRCELQ